MNLRDYNGRLQKSEDGLAAMDRAHSADRDQLTARFPSQEAAKDKPFRQRAAFLQQSTYPDSRTVAYGHYNADTGQLTAELGNDEYWFDQVPAKTAETMYKNWQKVKATQPLAEDDMQTRMLVLESGSISVTGHSRKAIEAVARKQAHAVIDRHLQSAKEQFNRYDYDGALMEYLTVLGQDPDNQAAKDGIAAVQAVRTHEAELLVHQRADGEWVDPRTHRMWTMADNGSDINWKEANKYCGALRTGGFSDWRLPDVRSLWGLYSPSETRITAKRAEHIKLFDTNSYTIFESTNGSPVEYHISGGIILTATWVWTMSRNNAGQFAIVKFRQGKWEFSGASEKTYLRALCVRNSQ